MSMYQQAVRGGAVQRLADWSLRPRHRIYDYHRRLTMWRRRVTSDGIVVRPFEPDAFSGGSLVSDFFAAAGVAMPEHGLEPVDVQNERLGAEATEFLRLLNLFRRQNSDLDHQELANRRFLPQLAALPGPALTLPAAALDEFMATWEESNRATAREFLGRDELFRAPRKASGTIATQGLDPTRFDQLVELLEIPGGLAMACDGSRPANLASDRARAPLSDGASAPSSRGRAARRRRTCRRRCAGSSTRRGPWSRPAAAAGHRRRCVEDRALSSTSDHA